MTREEKQKAIDALKTSAPVMAVTQEEFNDYIKTLNKIMDWLEQEPRTGHWIEDEYEMEVRCSVCGEENDECSKYCPKCGARMVERSE